MRTEQWSHILWDDKFDSDWCILQILETKNLKTLSQQGFLIGLASFLYKSKHKAKVGCSAKPPILVLLPNMENSCMPTAFTQKEFSHSYCHLYFTELLIITEKKTGRCSWILPWENKTKKKHWLVFWFLQISGFFLLLLCLVIWSCSFSFGLDTDALQQQRNTAILMK